ncbi:unnamed protein product [Darwinula stevensoni]|uniref:glutamate synthase (NADH) n=1 Tax=Darwinula stevensoni TaxID=69355 RepID=A0A7R8X7Y6_9CRUS|nr:unnamed protein product [Darwinula stevensoni]CAG0889586.1 unnamed protein product [Darwinula stevensoni]
MQSMTIDMTYPVSEGGDGILATIDRVCKEACEAAKSGYQFLILSDRSVSPERLVYTLSSNPKNNHYFWYIVLSWIGDIRVMPYGGGKRCVEADARSRVPVSALLCLGATHHFLIEARQRMKVALLLETGEARILRGAGIGVKPVSGDDLRERSRVVVLIERDFNRHALPRVGVLAFLEGGGGVLLLRLLARERVPVPGPMNQGLVGAEVHHMCVLIGYGCDAICPYLVLETMFQLRKEGVIDRYLKDFDVFGNYAAAMERGIAKVMAKMGISTMLSYKGAQIFEAVGLGPEIIDKCFKNSASRLGGITFRHLAEETFDRHRIAFDSKECDSLILRNPGFYHWRNGGEQHVNDPLSIARLQEASKSNSPETYRQYVEDAIKSIRACTLRGQLEFIPSEKPIDLSEVEPASEIVKRFATGAMSFGSISYEAHTSLAIAMNRVGGKSNTGEGGRQNNHIAPLKNEKNKELMKFCESPDRYLYHDPEYNLRSAIKQVASGRFGVTATYLANSDEIQIKMAQGAKPGEGGELPGYKAKAEHITISGHDGGTGASSWTGIKGAGLPWELGIAETHQVLTLNDLRSRIVLQVDGQIRTGFDVLIGGMLGADEFGFSTAPLIVLGCTMMRKCHLNTCPVGIATQDPILRRKFQGKPEHVINYLFLLAEEVRGYMACLGVRKFQDLIGRTDWLRVRKDVSGKSSFLDFSAVLQNASSLSPDVNIVAASVPQDFQLDSRLDSVLIEKAKDVLEKKAKKVDIEMEVENSQRTFAATLSYQIALKSLFGRKFGEIGLPDHSINIKLKGSSGQSFCAFLARGIHVTLEGDANDYVGKGLSGGEVVIFPPKDMGEDFKSEENVIAGNVCLYGATSGKAFFRGVVAERFCVRNSGAFAVVEGVGDHGCEYMTGGRVVILGPTGRNFAAGMSGGIAYVYDPHGTFKKKCNTVMVELLPLLFDEDIQLVYRLLIEFYEKTDSQVAKRILDQWPHPTKKFIKVFPFEYQRAMRQVQGRALVYQGSRSLSRQGSSISQTDFLFPPGSPTVKSGHEVHDTAPIKDIEDVLRDGHIERQCEFDRGFVKYRREIGVYRPAETRMKDWEEIYNFEHVRRGLRVQAARCMDCGVPFCQSAHGCPLGNIIPRWNDFVFHGEWKEALHQLLQTNNFPEFTGRVCPAPCEGACVLGINEPAVTIKNIECAIIDHAFEQGWIIPQPPKIRTGKKVAVIGSGPAGLAAAHQLNKVGHLVTVFERNDNIGGLLEYGIPTMKLSRKVVQRRVDLMAEEGIIFRTNANIGKDIPTKEIYDGYDAMVLCLGATWPRDLPLPGRNLNGIYFAMDFLETWQKTQMGTNIDFEKYSAKGKKVMVIGGGDTGCDCIATSLRMGAEEIKTLEILPKPPPHRGSDNPWPQWPKVFKVDYGHDEVKVKFGRDPRLYNTMTKEFLDDGNGNVRGVRTVKVEWRKDDRGRWEMKEVEGSEAVHETDMVLLAMGFLGPEKDIIDQLSLQLDPRSNINTLDGQYSTSIPRVFAAGDCRRGQSLVVWAIMEGRQAAREIDLFLMGDSSLPGPGGVIQILHPQG